MNRIEHLAASVTDLYSELDAEIAAFQGWSGLGCKFGCGKCCLKPDIEASPLEFIPFAVALHREGLTDNWLAKLDQAGPICVIYDEGQGGAGLCSRYLHRGLICRLFGFSARRNKYGRKELLTCQVIKTGQEKQYAAAQEAINQEEPVPVLTAWYGRLNALDPALGERLMPINEAIRTAIEVTETAFHYGAADNP
ncbi:MAG: YkgJ family cysteine cluster protein [Bacteroidota bacterium]